MAASSNSRENTFGRDLMRYVSSKLPYTTLNVADRINQLNPKYSLFYDRGTKRDEALTRQSVGSSISYTDDLYANVIQNKDYHEFMYANIQPDKGKRLMDYRVMAAYAEVADALDEICDEFVNKDEHGNIAVVKIKQTDLSDQQKTEIEKEFQKYMHYFDFGNKGWEYVRQLLVDSELYFEHIIHKDHPEEGVLGVLSIPSEAIDPIYSNVQNMLIKGYLLRKPIYDANQPGKIVKTEMIPMDSNQVTYVNSGIWNENKTLRLPFIENARRSYRQLSLVEDSLIITRLVRAPQRLVFNIDVGNMPAPKAEAYLRKLQSTYWGKKTFDSEQNSIVNQMNPQSMLDNYWFAKRQGSEGSTVTSLEGQGCLAMDTIVPLLDGRKLTITQIAEEFTQGKKLWTYSCDPNTGHIVPGLVTWAGITQNSAKVMKLTFDNGKELICTPDHKFPILGKGFVEAKDLELNESMIPFNTQLTPVSTTEKTAKLTYEQVYHNDSKEWQFTHRMVGKYFKNINQHTEFTHKPEFKNAIKFVIHHKDFNRFNNAPENLLYMNKIDHIIYHGDHTRFNNLNRTPELQQLMTVNAKKAIKKLKEDPIKAAIYLEQRLCSIAAANAKSVLLQKNPAYKKIIDDRRADRVRKFIKGMSKEEHKSYFNNITKKRHLNPEYQRKIKDIGDKMRLKFDEKILKFVIDTVRGTTYHQLCREKVANIINSTPEIINHFNNLNKDISIRCNFNQRLTKFKFWHLSMLAKQFGYKTFEHLRKESNLHNHRLVKVEYLDQEIPVGTLTIDGQEQYHNYHTFALDCGVFTKNSLGEIPDLYYFIKKLYSALKVPVSRLNADNVFNDGESMLREELKFARFVIRIQMRFAEGLKNGFVTHLKLKKIWEKCKLKEGHLDISFNVPTNFYELRENQKFQLKAENFNSMSNNPLVSVTFAQKKYLGWSDSDVMANREFLRKDSELKWEISQLEANGPGWKDMESTEVTPGAETGGGIGSAAPISGSDSGAPPAFGPGPEETAAPEGGTAAMPASGGTAPAAQPGGAQ